MYTQVLTLASSRPQQLFTDYWVVSFETQLSVDLQRKYLVGYKHASEIIKITKYIYIFHVWPSLEDPGPYILVQSIMEYILDLISESSPSLNILDSTNSMLVPLIELDHIPAQLSRTTFNSRPAWNVMEVIQLLAEQLWNICAATICQYSINLNQISSIILFKYKETN